MSKNEKPPEFQPVRQQLNELDGRILLLLKSMILQNNVNILNHELKNGLSGKSCYVYFTTIKKKKE